MIEFPDNGSEQMARGGAWLARASDPLAAFYNPAGLAGQGTQVTLQANMNMQQTCFNRVAAPDPGSSSGYDPVTSPPGLGAGGKFPQVCNSASPFPDPQIGASFRLTDRIGVGLVLVAPSSAGNATWPSVTQVGGSNVVSPNGFLLVSSNVLLFTPALGIGAEVLDGLRLGASFIAGTAPTIQFSSIAIGSPQVDYTYTNMAKATLSAKDLFIPGFTVGGIWSADSNVDIAAWYKWMAPIDAKGDLTSENPYYTARGTPLGTTYNGNTGSPTCGVTAPNSPSLCGSGNNGTIHINIPMEAKVGVRFHRPRPGVAQDHIRDPMKTDLWDMEVNLTWANNSALDAVRIRFPTNANGTAKLPLPFGDLTANVPPNADIPHGFKDVLGIRAGADVNVLPNRLAIRGGSFFETNGQNPTYQNIDFMGGWRFGLTVGATYRLIDVPRGGHLDFSAGYGHIFVQTTTNNGPNGVVATDGIAPAYRGTFPVNLGSISNSVDMFNVGATLRF